jgi:hypothetical protein
MCASGERVWISVGAGEGADNMALQLTKVLADIFQTNLSPERRQTAVQF